MRTVDAVFVNKFREKVYFYKFQIRCTIYNDCVSQIIFISFLVTLYPVIVVINSFSLDIGGCHNKKKSITYI